LFFYPSAFLPIEARELTGLETEFTKFKELETQIIACSPDTVWANTIFAASLGGLSFPLIGDIKKEVIKIYNVLREDGLSERATFIIDKDGILKWKKIYEISTERKISELLEELRKFKQQS
jgi:peroxiredoxin (alkyl hydroperoxide reductase subunit C)